MSANVLQIIVQGEDRASGVLGNVGGALSNFGSRATAIGQSLLPISIGAGVVAGSALKMAADYEQAMNILQATSGATAGEMALLDAKAIELGADITLPGTSALDASQAMLELSKAGLSVNDVMAASQGVLQMSAAAQISNAQAAEITANALNMFGLAGSEATMVADLLAAGANKSSAGVTDMADALKMSGAVAAAAGVPIQDVTTAIALMANQGIKGSDAGTSFKQMLLSLQAPTAKAKNLMNDLGISIYDASGTMLPMEAIIGQFSGALTGLTQEQRNAALSTIFGSDAVRAANVLLTEGTGAWTEMSAAVTAGGEAATLAAAQNAGLKGSLDGLKSALETAALTGAKPLLEALTPLVTKVSEAVGAFAEAHPEIVQAGVAFAGVISVAAPLALGIGAVATALGALLSPVGLVVVAVAGLAAAWVADFGDIRSTTETVMKAVQGVITSVMSAVQSFVTTAIAATSQVWTATWMVIKATTDSVLASIRSIVQSVLGAVQSFIASHGAEIKATLIGAWQTISQIINTVVQIISTVVTSVFGTIASFLANHKTEIVAVLTAAWNLIKTVIETTLNTILGIVNAVLKVLQGDWEGAWEEVKNVAATLWDGIHQIILNALTLILSLVGTNLTEVKNWFVNIFNEITGFLQGVVGQMADIGRSMIDGLIGGIKAKAGALVEAAKGVVSSAIAAAKNLLGIKSPSTVFQAIGVQAMAGLALGLGDTKETLDALGAHIGTIVDYLEYLANSVIAPAAVASAKAITDPLKAIFDNVVGILGGLDAFMSFKPGTDEQGVVYIIDRVATTVQQVIGAFAHLAGIVDGGQVWSSKAFTDPLKTIFDNVKTIVEGASALAEFAGREIKGDVSGAIQQIGVIVRDMVLALSDAALHVADLGGVAKIFAENAGPVVGLVEEGLGALTAMGDWETVDWGPVSSGISQLTMFLQSLVGWIGFAGRLVETELQESARTFAEAAGPVVSIVEEGLGALAAMGNWTVIDWGPVSAALPQLTTFLERLVGWIGLAGRLVGTELAGAAAAFAESAKPVVDIVGGGLESLAALGAWDRRVNFTEIDAAIQRLGQYLQMLVGWFSYQAKKLSEDALSAAKAFAEATGPVVGVVEGGLKSLAALGAWDGIVNFAEIDTAMQRLSLSIEMLIAWFSYQASKLEEGALGAATDFANSASAVLKVVEDALKVMGEIAGFTPPSTDELAALLSGAETFLLELMGSIGGMGATVGVLLDAANVYLLNLNATLASVKTALATLGEIGAQQAPAVGLQWVTELANSMKAAVPSLQEVLDSIIAALRAATDSIPIGAFEAGAAWVDGITNGILAGLPGLEAAVAQVAATLASVSGNATLTAESAPPMSTGMPAAQPVTVTNSVTITNPVVREDVDIQKIADAVSASLSGKASTYTRMAVA